MNQPILNTQTTVFTTEQVGRRLEKWAQELGIPGEAEAARGRLLARVLESLIIEDGKLIMEPIERA